MTENYTNVGIGMVPHRKGCKCDECEVERLSAENEDLEKRNELLEAVAEAAKALEGQGKWGGVQSEWVRLAETLDELEAST